MAALPALDLPPGDVYSPTVENDTASAVVVSTCHASCTGGDISGVEVAPASRSSRFNVNARGGSGLIVHDRTSGSLLGCLTPDADALGNVDSRRALKVSAAASCVEAVPEPSAPLVSEVGLLSWLVAGASLVPLVIVSRKRRRGSLVATF